MPFRIVTKFHEDRLKLFDLREWISLIWDIFFTKVVYKNIKSASLRPSIL